MPKKQKFYCYVDETGQDTKGRIFVVAVVVTEENRDEILNLCEQLESVSGKLKDKWGAAKHDRRMLYVRHIFADKRLQKCLRYAVYKGTIDYDAATIEVISKAMKWDKPNGKYTALIYIDGLSKTKRQEYGAQLRHLGLPVRRVRGVARDETNALTRLADAIAGFVRDALDGKSEEISTLLSRAQEEGMLVRIKA